MYVYGVFGTLNLKDHVVERDVIILLLKPIRPKKTSVLDNLQNAPVTNDRIFQMKVITPENYSAGFNIKSSFKEIQCLSILKKNKRKHHPSPHLQGLISATWDPSVTAKKNNNIPFELQET